MSVLANLANRRILRLPSPQSTDRALSRVVLGTPLLLRMASGLSSPPAKRLRTTRQLTLEESVAGLGASSSKRETKGLHHDMSDNTPPLFSDSELGSDQDTLPLDSGPCTPKSPTLSNPLSPSSPPPTHRGTPLSDISFGPSCSPILPPLSSSPTHTVMFRPRLRSGEPPLPFPDTFRDVWDGNHVRSPCSAQNLYPTTTETGEKKLLSRWALIKTSLSKPINNSYDLEEAILEYNSRQASKWSFGTLHAYFSEIASEEETSAFFSSILPRVIALALRLPELVTHALPLFRSQETYSVTLSQQQAACLLANAFLCTFPRRNAMHKAAEYASYPSINFNSLFSGKSSSSISAVQAAKLQCIFHYLTRVTATAPTGSITFTRQVCTNPPQWDRCTARLTKLHITSEGTIEDNGHGMLQVDFANRRVGGGVLGGGCVQEEIRFLLCPELILSRLFTEELQENECLVVTGAEQFSTYRGYASTFEWAGMYNDDVARDRWGRKETCLVAMDALVIRNHASQFKPGLMRRELTKAYCSFMSTETTPCRRPMATATGNWGCGAFGGDKRLKAVLQWLAASAAGRDVVYFTFEDTSLQEDLHILQLELVARQVTVGAVWRELVTYHRQTPHPPLYRFLLDQLGCHSNTTSPQTE